MAEVRSIEIDLEVHKRIELARKSFGESDNAVLRRLLGIAEVAAGIAPASLQSSAAKPVTSNGGARNWTMDGVSLPHGTRMRMTYNGQTHEGSVDDGSWIVEGKRRSSPSDACRVARTKEGHPPSLNGWKVWQVLRPGDREWVSLQRLRNEARRQ